MLVIILLGLIFTITSLILIVHHGFPGSVKNIAWRMSGVWVNSSNNTHVMVFHSGDFLKGQIVWSNNKEMQHSLIGSYIFNEMKLKPFWRWSSGQYIEPITNEVHPFRLRLKSNSVMSIHFLTTADGEQSMVHEEEWHLIDPL